MANRPVFVFNNGQYYQHHLDFKWHSGFAVAQKQKCVEELHAVFKSLYPDSEVLEVSTKSNEDLGIELSAFNLVGYKGLHVETLFQASKVFEKGGPYTDLLEVSGAEAKKDKRLRNSGDLVAFNYFGEELPLEPKTLAYNWIYLKALMQHKDLQERVLKYSAFTDIEFNPEKSINCQAQALSIFVALVNHGLLEQAMVSVESFKNIVYGVN